MLSDGEFFFNNTTLLVLVLNVAGKAVQWRKAKWHHHWTGLIVHLGCFSRRNPLKILRFLWLLVLYRLLWLLVLRLGESQNIFLL